MSPDPYLDAGRQRTALRNLVRQRGPEVGREVDHLKMASLRGTGEALLERFEAGLIPADATSDLTRRDGDGVDVLFMLDVSTLDGADVLE